MPMIPMAHCKKCGGELTPRRKESLGMSEAALDYVLSVDGTDKRKWKQLKRKQIDAAIEAINDLRAGSAYFPSGGDDVQLITDALYRIKADCSVRNWGR